MARSGSEAPLTTIGVDTKWPFGAVDWKKLGHKVERQKSISFEKFLKPPSFPSSASLRLCASYSSAPHPC